MSNISAIIFGLSLLDVILVLAASVTTFIITHRFFSRKAGERMNNFLINSLVNEQEQYIAFLDINGTVVLANKSFEDLVGLSSNNMIGKQLADLPIQNDILTAFTKNNDKITDGKSTVITYNHSILNNKESCWLQIQKRTLLLKNPDVTYILVVATDISDKKKVEELLSFTKNEYQQLVESAGDIIFQTDLSGKFTYINNVVHKILDYSEEEAMQMSLQDLIFEDDVDRVNDFYDSKFSGSQKDGYIEFRVLSKSGDVKWLGQTVTIINKHNESVGFQAVARDITDMKVAEAQLKRAKQIAEEASEAKSNFIASMSHEFRTPLNAIIGYSQILERNSSLLSEEKDHVKEVRKGGEQLLGIVNDILALTVLDSDKITIENEEVIPFPFMENFGNRYSKIAHQSGLGFNLEHPENAHTLVSVDINKLSIVVKNLIENAIKFTKKGAVELSYDIITGASKNAFFSITVKDTGVGIAEQELEKIYDPFWQSDPLKNAGTGLGLTLIKRLVTFLEGEILVESTVEKGSEFTINIPVEISESKTIHGVISETGLYSSSKKKGGKGIKALIVDDLEANRTITRIILSENGIDYREAENGEEALSVLEDYDADVVLMDINMPVLDGIDAMLTIRARDWEHREIPIIAVTAGAKGTKAELLEQGFSDYILKPFREEELMDSIFSHLGSDFSKLLEVPDVSENVESEISPKEVAIFLSQVPKKVRKAVQDILQLQDFNGLSKLLKKKSFDAFLDHPAHTKLISIANNFDYLFATKLLKELKSSKAKSPLDVHNNA